MCGLQFAHESTRAQQGKIMAVVLAMVFHGMATADDFPAYIRIACRFFAHAEKGGVGSIAIQNIQHLRGDEGVGAIVDGEGDFILAAAAAGSRVQFGPSQ